MCRNLTYDMFIAGKQAQLVIFYKRISKVLKVTLGDPKQANRAEETRRGMLTDAGMYPVTVTLNKGSF